MGINVRTKGAEGEREVARALNSIVHSVLTARAIPIPPVDIIQRNQNQSAVGGSDLKNPFGLAIEVKRQEQLAVNTWWAQCIASAERANELPILLYRQNGKRAWHVVMMGSLAGYAPVEQNSVSLLVRCEVEWDSFLQWFYHWVDRKIHHGLEVRA